MSKKVLASISLIMMLVLSLPLSAQKGNTQGGSFEQELRRIADRCFTDANARLTGDANNKLNNFIQQGVRKLKAAGANEANKKRAKRSIETFATEMINKGHRQQNGSIKVDGNSFLDALQICPLWPFCD